MLLTPFTRAWLAAPAAALALLPLPLTAHAQAASPTGAGATAGSDMSAAQQARLQARQAQFQKDVAALKADAKMTDAQKQAKYATLVQGMDKDILAMLTPAQRAEEMKRQQINTQFQKDVAVLRADRKMTDAQKKARFHALAQTADTQTLATLTPSQRALVLKRRQATEAATRMGKELQNSLTPAQEKQIHSIALAAGTQVQTVIADKSLAPAAKTAKINDLEKQAQGKINALLTPSQRTMYAHLQSLVPTSTSP